MTNKVRINPALIAALEHYAAGWYNPLQPSVFVQKDDSGFQQSWTLEQTCGMAADVLADEDLNLLRFNLLKDGLKEFGMGSLYEHIMGDKLDA